MSKKIVYAYRMTSDTGHAPCAFTDGYNSSELLSLACCKGGQLRHKKGNPEEITEVNTGLRYTLGKKYMEAVKNGEVELYVIGILKDRIIWCAQITNIISMIEYFSDKKTYGNRLDFIYDVKKPVDNGAKTGNLVRNGRSQLFHGESMTEQHKRDELGEYVLLSDKFVYFGCDVRTITSDTSDLILKFPKKQECRCYSDAEEDIISFVEGMMATVLHEIEPTERLTEDNCSRCQPK